MRDKNFCFCLVPYLLVCPVSETVLQSNIVQLGLFGIDDLEKREIKTRELEEKSGISRVWESNSVFGRAKKQVRVT
jgi:hypothetical protein